MDDEASPEVKRGRGRPRKLPTGPCFQPATKQAGRPAVFEYGDLLRVWIHVEIAKLRYPDLTESGICAKIERVTRGRGSLGWAAHVKGLNQTHTLEIKHVVRTAGTLRKRYSEAKRLLKDTPGLEATWRRELFEHRVDDRAITLAEIAGKPDEHGHFFAIARRELSAEPQGNQPT